MSAPSCQSVTVRAPGKLFLLGEYAVLFGAPAIVQAVDRYVEVTAGPTEDSATAVEVHSQGAVLPVLRATWHRETLNFIEPKPQHGLVVALLNALCDRGVLQPAMNGVRLTIDSRQLFHQGSKLGLGSSAAVSHGVVQAVRYFMAELYDDLPVLPDNFVFDVHQAFQHGKGSGADLAAGLLGGTFWYRRTDQTTRFEAASVELPERVNRSFIWVGEPASTTDALLSLGDFQEQYPQGFDRALAPLTALAESAAGAVAAGQAERFVRDCEAYGHNLSEFGRTVGIDIMSQAHRTLRDLADRFGVAYKPSGAGNGDFGVAYSLGINALREFEKAVVDLGFAPVALAVGRACHRI